MTNMAPITTVSLRPPAKSYTGPTAQEAVQVEIIPIDRLRIDHAYQRDITSKSRSTLTRIAREFTWARFGALMVSVIDDGYAVIDGQHRAMAAATIGLTEVPCLIITADQVGQALDFVAVNTTRTKIMPMDAFRATCVAGDIHALEMNEILQGLQIRLTSQPTSNARGRETRAISTLLRLLKKRGKGQTYTLLELLTDAGDEPDYLASFALTTTDALLEDILKIGGDLNRLLDLLKNTRFDEMRSDAARASRMFGGNTTKNGHAMLVLAWNKANPGKKIKK